MKKIITKIKEMFFNIEFIKFVAIGCINTLNGILFSYVFSIFLNENLAFVVGYILGLFISYLLNSFFTFKEKLHIKKFVKFAISYIPNFIIQNVVVILVFNVLGYHKLIAYALAAIIGVPITFLFMKLFAFNNKETGINGVFIKLSSKVKKCLNDVLHNKMSKFRAIVLIDMLLKSICVMAIIQEDSANSLKFSKISFRYAIIYLAFILIFYSFSYLLSKNKQIIYLWCMNVLYSILLIFDLSYYRVSRDFLGLKHILYPDSFNTMNDSVINFEKIDLIFIIDLVVILIWFILRKVRNEERRSAKKFAITLIPSISIILVGGLLLDILNINGYNETIFDKRWDVEMSATAPGPLGYHTLEIVRTLYKKTNRINELDKEEIDAWFKYNREDLEKNEYFGCIKGKNIVLLQVESLENFVINKKVEGKYIMPFLTKLSQEGIYCSNFYEQNSGGHSIDCDFLVNTSIYPLEDFITAVNYGENVYSNSLPRILKRNGYNTITTHAEELNSFNWTELHKCGFDPDDIWALNDFDYDERVGYGLSDKSYLSQVANKLENVKEPFLIQIPTLSSHGPFDIQSVYRELDLPSDIDKSKLGGYFQSLRYTDNQIKRFYNMLSESGIMKDTVFVIYGDHTGVHNYYNDEIKDLDYDGNWWKEYDHKIPLIIYGEGINPTEVTVSGGQVDILPTLCYLLGIDDEEYKNTSMGRVLLNTNRDATLRRWRIIEGNIRNNEERDFILKSYYIGNRIIMNDYMNKK